MDISKTLKLTFDDVNKRQSIGTKQEKFIHQFLKYFICEDSSKHEIIIGNRVADCVINNHIYEIQTRSLYKLKDKLSLFLKEYKVTVVFPVYNSKLVKYIDENGEVVSVRKSPKKGCPLDLLPELYALYRFLENPNFAIKIIIMEIEETQTTRIDKYKRKKRTPIDKYPLDIIDIIDITSSNSLRNILPKELLDNQSFTANDFNRLVKLKGRKASNALQVLKKLNIIEFIGKDNRKYLYRVK